MRRPPASGARGMSSAGVVDVAKHMTDIPHRAIVIGIWPRAPLKQAVERRWGHATDGRTQNGGRLPDCAVERASACQHLYARGRTRRCRCAHRRLPWACSGDMYCTVPRIMCSPVNVCRPVGHSDGACASL